MILGLTGGICTGKSTVAGIFGAAGAHIVDCDVIAHYLTDYEPCVRSELQAVFGSEVFHPCGKVLREVVSKRVLENAEKRRELEQILHPRILKVLERNIAAARKDKQHLVGVVPLLYEIGLQEHFDQVWVVASTSENQIERMKQRGLSEDMAQAWLAVQWPLDRKVVLADFVLHNNDKIAALTTAAQNAWEGLTKGCT